MRLLECLRLRIKGLDFTRREITGRDGKGGKGRRTTRIADHSGVATTHVHTHVPNRDGRGVRGPLDRD